MSVIEFLLYAGTSAGVNAVLGFLLSFVLDWWPEYGDLSARVKRLVSMVLSFVIPLCSLAGLWLLGEMGITVETVWSALAAGFVAFFGSQASHIRDLGAREAAAQSVQAQLEELYGDPTTRSG